MLAVRGFRPLVQSPARAAYSATLLRAGAATFSTLSPRLSPAPSTPARASETGGGGVLETFQSHPADTVPPPASSIQVPSKKETIHSRPWADWVIWHPAYAEEELDAVRVVRHKRTTVGDKFASALVSVSRWGFDFVTRYKHSSPEAARAALEKAGIQNAGLEVLREKGYIMTVPQWMIRILFLETIAGIPGMVGGILRHLQSLRLMRRDGGWISTLLQEAENERMHLMTFLKIKEPSVFFRLIVLAAQGVYFNAFFVLYLISPKSAHRFVGYLEEEAVLTYTQILDEIKRGNIPEWGTGPDAQKVPQIAKDYWRLHQDCTMVDLLRAVRADEAGHRFVNHTLANLDQKNDFNPFGVRHADARMQGTLPGISREESLAWSKKVEEDMRKARLLAEQSDKEGGAVKM